MSSDTTTDTLPHDHDRGSDCCARPRLRRPRRPPLRSTSQAGPWTSADQPADQSAAVEAQAAAAAQAAPAVSETAAVQAAVTQHVRAGVAANGAKAQAPEVSKEDQGAHATSFDRQAPVISSQPKVLRAPVDREPEADEPNVAATIWLHRTLPIRRPRRGA